MPIDTGNDSLDRQLNDQLALLASRGTPQGNLLSPESRIREAAFYNFSQYRYILPPHYARRVEKTPYPGQPTAGEDTDVSLGVWLEFDDFVKLFERSIHAAVVLWVATMETIKIERVDGYGRVWLVDGLAFQRQVHNIQVSSLEGFALGMGPSLFEIYVVTPDPEGFLLAAEEVVEHWLEDKLSDLRRDDGTYLEDDINSIRLSRFWEEGLSSVLAQLASYLPSDPLAPEDDGDEFGEVLPDNYEFEPFKFGTVNFGIQSVYRQGWTPLGTQPGEIVRTLPLAPKQTEKISVKAIRRTKSTRQVEIVTSVETATESSAATKDSSEVIEEASDSSNWHAEASANASFGFGGVSVSGGVGGESSDASKETKAQLNETVEKTASKIKRDTKIVVSTESEESSEFSQVSEITNPNDEIAVTHIYSRLQRQYEIQTYLAEVNRVVFIAERLPAPGEITEQWIRRYEWIISRVLLDESFQEDLGVIREGRGATGDTTPDSNIERLMQTLSGDGSGGVPGVPSYGSLPGTIPDLYRAQQSAYERELERSRAKVSQRDRYDRSLHRIKAHLYDNILHYCRAIWSSEDPEARLLRYRKIRVPRKWEFVATSTGQHSSRGYFTPSVRDIGEDTVPLAEMVNPAGPIGFAGNYAVFYMRRSSRWSALEKMLRIVETPFLKTGVEILRDGIGPATKIRAVVSDNIAGPAQVRFDFAQDSDNLPVLQVSQQTDGDTWVFVRDIRIRDGKPIVALGLRVWVTGVDELKVGDSFVVRVWVEQALEDPEVKALKWSLPPLAKPDEFFDVETINDMRGMFSEAFVRLRDRPVGVSWNSLNPDERKMLENLYYDYVLRKRHTRKILLDTNNLMLTREVDDATTLESFKGLHRVIDILRAAEELKHQILENTRRQQRVASGKLGDPDVEKVTVVAGGRDLANWAAVDGLEPDPTREEEREE